MTERQTQMWDTLVGLDGETVARLLTDWHGLQLLDDGFYGHMVEEGYIDGPAEDEDEENNCEAGTYDCDTCPLEGVCERKGTEELEQAKLAETFDEFCGSFHGCTYCPFDGEIEDCEKVLWPRWKEREQ